MWKCRNDLVFNGIKTRPDIACRLAFLDAEYYVNAMEGPRRGSIEERSVRVQEQTCWQYPQEGWVKINFDAGLDRHNRCGGVGVVICDSTGRFRAARSVHTPNLVDSLLGEALAARESYKFAEELVFERIVFEGDSKQVIQLIHRQTEEHNKLAVVLADINHARSVFSESLVQFVRRGGNGVAHIPPSWLLSSLVRDGCPI